jgi:cytochrome o ubiquinol oxidase operon protein cyoD
MADPGPLSSAARDLAPGANARDPGVANYLIGLGLAVILTGASFWAAGTHLIWSQAVPIALAVLALAQIGVHLVFFLHLSSAPDNTNNILALAFGILIVFLVVAGSLWIMANLNANMLPMSELMRMQR